MFGSPGFENISYKRIFSSPAIPHNDRHVFRGRQRSQQVRLTYNSAAPLELSCTLNNLE